MNENLKNKYLKVLKESYIGNNKDLEIFEEIMNDNGLAKCKPVFNLKAFIFGWFYLLYRKMVKEAIGVIMAALMIGYLMAHAKLHPLIVLSAIIVISSVLSGFCYYFLYLNKFDRDMDYCGEYNPDMECIKKRAKPTFIYVIIAILIILIFIWPWIYALVTGANLKN